MSDHRDDMARLDIESFRRRHADWLSRIAYSPLYCLPEAAIDRLCQPYLGGPTLFDRCDIRAEQDLFLLCNAGHILPKSTNITIVPDRQEGLARHARRTFCHSVGTVLSQERPQEWTPQRPAHRPIRADEAKPFVSTILSWVTVVSTDLTQAANQAMARQRDPRSSGTNNSRITEVDLLADARTVDPKTRREADLASSGVTPEPLPYGFQPRPADAGEAAARPRPSPHRSN